MLRRNTPEPHLDIEVEQFSLSPDGSFRDFGVPFCTVTLRESHRKCGEQSHPGQRQHPRRPGREF